MNSATTTGASLDPAQSAVVEAPASARSLVTAGPGTGKTFTLLKRAQWLVDECGIEPSPGLMILSFSRAAVETVARRGHLEIDLGRLPVWTVDSMASRILFESGVETDHMSFDDRICAASRALGSNAAARNLVTETRHVLVDEAQDVVGVRGELVNDLIELICSDRESGFTVFGDAAQSIFDFQLDGLATGPRLLELVRGSRVGADQHELQINYRMRDPRLVDFASRMGAELRDSTERSGSRLRRGVETHILKSPGWTRLDDAAPEIQAAYEGPTRPRVAVLCRSNAECLQLGSHLQAAGLDVRVQHRALDRGGAAWLAGLFGSVPVPRSSIPEEPQTWGRPWMRPPEETLRLLRQARLARDRDVDLDRLASMLRSGACPEELIARHDAAVTVSTIHRAKGLEYDTVFVVESMQRPDAETTLEEARVLYVAATRARDELVSGAALEIDGLIVNTAEGGRTKVCWWHKRKRAKYLEVKVSDTDGDWAPPGRDEFDRVERFLAADLLPGDPMELRLSADSTEEEPSYDLIHMGGEAEVCLGRTTPTFGAMLNREVWGRPPSTISGLTAEIPDTASMTVRTARQLDLGDHGLHLRARAFGLGRLGWNQ